MTMNIRKLTTIAAITALGVTGAALAQSTATPETPPEATLEVAPEATAEPTPVTEYPGAEWVEAGGLRFLLPPEVANSVTETVVEGVPFDPNVMFSSTYPGHARIDFVDYLPDSAPEITHNFNFQPTIYVFDTAEFETYVSEDGGGYPAQVGLLRGIIDGTIRRSPETQSPYLPMINAAQIFHAREQVVRFNGGWGLVYLTTFAQDVYPVAEGTVQLTFQGITDDGSTYIAATFPLDTGYFPDEIPSDFDFEAFSAGYTEYLTETREALESLPADAFAPNFDALLALVGSIEVQQ
jgi:hypothetical protein